jgi:hypothetical protein
MNILNYGDLAAEVLLDWDVFSEPVSMPLHLISSLLRIWIGCLLILKM